MRLLKDEYTWLFVDTTALDQGYYGGMYGLQMRPMHKGTPSKAMKKGMATHLWCRRLHWKCCYLKRLVRGIRHGVDSVVVWKARLDTTEYMLQHCTYHHSKYRQQLGRLFGHTSFKGMKHHLFLLPSKSIERCDRIILLLQKGNDIHTCWTGSTRRAVLHHPGVEEGS